MVRAAVQRRPRSQSSHASANREAPVHRVRDGSSDTRDLRLLLISCAASAQWWAGARDDLKMRQNAKRLEETGVRERPRYSNRANVCINKKGVSTNLAPGQIPEWSGSISRVRQARSRLKDVAEIGG